VVKLINMAQPGNLTLVQFTSPRWSQYAHWWSEASTTGTKDCRFDVAVVYVPNVN